MRLALSGLSIAFIGCSGDGGLAVQSADIGGGGHLDMPPPNERGSSAGGASLDGGAVDSGGVAARGGSEGLRRDGSATAASAGADGNAGAGGAGSAEASVGTADAGTGWAGAFGQGGAAPGTSLPVVDGSPGVGGGTTVPRDPWRLAPATCLSKTEPGFPKRSHPLSPASLWSSSLNSPRPTNSFWMNLVLNQGTQRINVLPYQVKAQQAGLSVACPSLEASETSVITADRTDVLLASRESMSGHQVTAYDDLSVTVTWTSTNGTLRTPLVYGMPYATGLYSGLTPTIKMPSAAIVRVNGATTSPVTSDKVVLTLNNGQTWNLYSSSPLKWTWTSSELLADKPLTGSVRLALVPEEAASAILDSHAAAIPIGGSVNLSDDAATGVVGFEWKRQGDGDLLMMALPHHLPRLSSPKQRALAHDTLMGPMAAIAGDDWTLRYPLSAITWTAPRPPAASSLAAIQSSLQQDSAFAPSAADPYFGGKQLAKLARLQMIAKEVGEASMQSTFLDRLRTHVSAWLDGTNAQPLVYDSTWGGLVTAAGIKSSDADFGQGYYNDHHFHYGYHAYAAAAVAREDSAWASQYADKALWMARDIANPCRDDPYFPRFRNFDWFVGHSWAAGLFEFGDGRNQESSSEAVNAWYGIELLGLALGNDTLAHVGAILRAVETASAQTYWQITEASEIYPQPFKARHVVGVLWSTKVDFATFFGANPEFIYGIQMLPFTPATEDLLQPTWVANTWPQLSAAAQSATEQGWKGFMHMAHAIIEKNAAMADLQKLTGYDDGNSRANTLYWAATRP